jgi:hypothetical protein
MPAVIEEPESRKSRAGRHPRRTALYVAAALLAAALVFGHSHVSLVLHDEDHEQHPADPHAAGVSS